ncbi:MAG TPA: 2-oxo acid dehydrogenase subunit E2, partial [Chthoniobacteraceae bacterium]|nr:2-oxo acid dehydrogenase subunit E2 [Chthoniobacteraceae bacterium]
FIKATVSALKAVPSVNGRMEGDDFIQNHYFDVGVAVGTERGLIVPVIRDADQLSIHGLNAAIADVAARAKAGKFKVDDFGGGTFTVDNTGYLGTNLVMPILNVPEVGIVTMEAITKRPVVVSTPILNPPQSGILGMHKIQERPVAEKGQAVVRPMMYLALSYDHRVVDGKEAVTFLVRVKDCIEQPSRLLLDL